jgi:acylphosphatase
MAGARDDVKTIRWLISGRVQGVGYRYFARQTAAALGIMGTVKNLPDGRVEIYAKASADILEIFYQELERGPLRSSISTIDSQEVIEPGTQYTDFRIIF